MSEIIKYMFDIVKCQIEMIQDRNYPLDEEELNILKMTKDQFVDFYTQRLNEENTNIYDYFTKYYYADNMNELYVKYDNPVENEGEGINVNKIKLLLTTALEDDHKPDIIYITGQNLNSAASKEFYNYFLKKTHFLHSELRYNPTKHFSNSKFELLTRAEVFQFVRENKINNIRNIPYMTDIDPIVLYYGLVPGNVVRITRTHNFYDSILDSSISYRLVVKHPKVEIKKRETKTAGTKDSSATGGTGGGKNDDSGDM